MNETAFLLTVIHHILCDFVCSFSLKSGKELSLQMNVVWACLELIVCCN